MPDKVKDPASDQPSAEPASAPPEPIRIVRRRIECPDGSTVEVDVPVYAPFRFEFGDPDSPVEEVAARKRATVVAKGPRRPVVRDARKDGPSKAKKVGSVEGEQVPKLAKAGGGAKKTRS